MSEPTWVKKTKCPQCCAPKVQPSLFAFVYCDYCAAFIDCDFQATVSDKRSKLPGPAYEALYKQVQPELDAAQKKKDLAGYVAVYSRVLESYADHCPAAHSIRIHDPVYRKAFIAFSTLCAAHLAMNDEMKALTDEQGVTIKNLKWKTKGLGKYQVEPEGFWAMYQTVKKVLALSNQVTESLGLYQHHPDHPSDELNRRMGMSAFVQGWLPMMSKAEADKLLAETGLKDEYISAPPVKLGERNCGKCGKKVEVPEGAKQCLCESCGFVLDVARGQVPCPGCNAASSVPRDTSLFNCPYCEAELRVMAWAGT